MPASSKVIDVSAEFEQEDSHAIDSIGKIETPSFLVLCTSGCMSP